MVLIGCDYCGFLNRSHYVLETYVFSSLVNMDWESILLLRKEERDKKSGRVLGHFWARNISYQSNGVLLLRAQGRESIFSWRTVKQAKTTSIMEEVMISIFHLMRMRVKVQGMTSHSNVLQCWCVIYCKGWIWCAAIIDAVNCWTFFTNTWQIYWSLSVDIN